MKNFGSTPYPTNWESSKSKKRAGDPLGMSVKSNRVKKMLREREKKAYRALLKTFTKWTDDKEDVDSENVKGLPGIILDTSCVSEIKALDNSQLNNTTISLINDSNISIKQPHESTPASKNCASIRKVFARDLIITPKVQVPVVVELEEKKIEPVKSEPEFKLPMLPKSYENYKLEKAEKQKLFSREWINDMRRAIQDGHLEAEKIRRQKEDYLRIIGKKREVFMRKFRRETSKSLCEADFSYLPYFYRFFSDEIIEPEEEAEETEEDYDEAEESEEEEEDEEEDEDDSLPEEALQVIEDCFSKRKDELVVEENGVEVRVKDLETLKGTSWLNDEVINFYFQLIQKRSVDNKESPSNLKVYCFNTFFYKRLTEGGHKALKRWTKKVDLFSYDLILIPVHLSVHWTLAAISIRDSTINYYDSMSGNNRECLSHLLKYLEDEMKDKKQQVLDTSNWECHIVKDIPQQENGSDCGVFTCKYAERLALDKPFNFSQRNIPFIRQKMIYEISQKELLMDKTFKDV